jgi:hypothetical protein
LYCKSHSRIPSFVFGFTLPEKDITSQLQLSQKHGFLMRVNLWRNKVVIPFSGRVNPKTKEGILEWDLQYNLPY